MFKTSDIAETLWGKAPRGKIPWGFPDPGEIKIVTSYDFSQKYYSDPKNVKILSLIFLSLFVAISYFSLSFWPCCLFCYMFFLAVSCLSLCYAWSVSMFSLVFVFYFGSTADLTTGVTLE
jgi:hypothetical protein